MNYDNNINTIIISQQKHHKIKKGALTMSSSTQYLKQYLCYEHQKLLRNAYKPSKTLSLQFKGITPYIHHDLTHHILDTVSSLTSDNSNSNGCNGQRLYLCKWYSNATILDILEFGNNKNSNNSNSQGIVRIQMNSKPMFVKIASKQIFVVGGSQLFIVDIDTMTISNNYALGSEIIHAVQCAIKNNDANTIGVYVYSWNDKHGYRKRFFSSTTSEQFSWWTSIASTITFRKAPKQYKNSILKVILPNIVGMILFQNGQQICLINLSTMQPIQHTTQKLTDWHCLNLQKLVVKYYLNKNSSGFDDGLLISLGEKDREIVQVWALHVKYHSDVKDKIRAMRQESQISDVGLTDMTSGDVVDWGVCVLQTFFTVNTQGKLLDYLLTQNGIIFYSQSSTKIPISSFVPYLTPLSPCPILSLQHKICSSFLYDCSLFSKLQQLKRSPQSSLTPQQQSQLPSIQNKILNSLLQPNRYTLNFLYNSLNTEPVSNITIKNINCRQLLIDWYRVYRVRGLCVYKGDVVVMREFGIGSFLGIQKKQYQAQWQSGEEIMSNLEKFGNIDGNMKENGENRSHADSFDLSIGESKYSMDMVIDKKSEDLWWKNIYDHDHDMGFSFQKSGEFNSIYSENGSLNYNKVQLAETYERYLGYFYTKSTSKIVQNTQNLYQQQQIALKSQIFAQKLIINRIKDIFSYFSRSICTLYTKTSAYHCHSVTFWKQMQKCFINYLIFLKKLIDQPLDQVCAHGIDLLEIFIMQEIGKSRTNYSTNQNKQRSNNKQRDLDVFVNVDKQAWKIINLIFDQIAVAQDKQNNKNINLFIKLMLTNIKSGHQYIQNLLLDTFAPYHHAHFSNFHRIHALNQNNQQNGEYHSQHKHHHSHSDKHQYINFSKQQSHFPLNATLLSIYCFLPMPQQTHDELISAFLLRRIINQDRPQILLNQMLSKVFGNKFFKQKVRSLYAQITQNKGNLAQSLLQIKSQRQSTDKQSSSPYQNPVQSQIDNSRGIMHLIQVLPAQTLQSHLLSLNPEQLDSIFRSNMQILLTSSFTQQQNYPHSQKHTNQQLLTSWIFKFRLYVKLYRKLITQIKSKIQSGADYNSRNDKNRLENIVYVCLAAIQNVRNYYFGLYNNTREVRDKDQSKEFFHQKDYDNNFMNISDQQLIQKICCRMLGFDTCHDLHLYSKSINQNQRILPTAQFLKILHTLLRDPQTYAQTVSGLDSIAYYYLNKVLEEPSKNMQYLNILSKYYSRRELSRIVLQNGILRQRYQRLGGNNKEQSKAVREYFGYCDVMRLAIGSAVNRAKELVNQNNKDGSAGQHNRGGSSRRIQNVQYEENSDGYGVLAFRNMYLEAIGR